MVLLPRAVQPSFAVQTYHVGVYWDAACTRPVTSISWGELTPGATAQAQVFIRNEDLDPACYLNLNDTDWVPAAAERYFTLGWNYRNQKVALGTSTPVTLTLTVARTIWGITNFNFTIIIFGTEHLLGDVDHDDDVDIFDLVLLTTAYASTNTSPNWRPEADLREDNEINIYDVVLLTHNYGAKG